MNHATGGQNFILVWLKHTNEVLEERFQQIYEKLNSSGFCLMKVVNLDRCEQCLDEIQNKKVSLILSNTLGQHLVPLIHENPRVFEIYVLCNSETKHSRWANNWPKIRGPFSNSDSLHQLLAKHKRHNELAIESISIVPMTESSSSIDGIDMSFIYTQVLKEVLLSMEYGRDAIFEFTAYCRELFTKNRDIENLQVVQELESSYYQHSPIWWYTRECFLYYMLNQALRTQDLRTTIKMGFFLKDLHCEIDAIHRDNNIKQLLTVYRGQELLKTDLEKMQKNRVCLLSFNNFLSTSLQRDVSLRFATNIRPQNEMTGILFSITIDPDKTNIPFALVGARGYFDQLEEEILFSMHTVFQVEQIIRLNSELWEVKLQMTSDDDQLLQALIQQIRFTIRGSTEQHRLGNLMLHLKYFTDAEYYYHNLLESTSEYDKMEIVHLSTNLAYIMEQTENYEQADYYYKKVLEIEESSLPQMHQNLAEIYCKIGIVKSRMNQNQIAKSFLSRAISILNHNKVSRTDQLFQACQEALNSLENRQ